MFLFSLTCSSSSSPPLCDSLFVTCHVSKLTSPLLPLPPLQMVSPRFATCHISELTNPFLPLPPLQKAIPHFQPAMFPSSPTRFSSSSPPRKDSSSSDLPSFLTHPL